MAFCPRLWFAGAVILLVLVGCRPGKPDFEQRQQRIAERKQAATQAGLLQFPEARDLDTVALRSLYAVEVERLLTSETGLWYLLTREVDLQSAEEGYLLTFAGRWTPEGDYYVHLAVTEEQGRQFLRVPPEERHRRGYLLVFHVASVAKPSIQVDSEVLDYDEGAAITALAFGKVEARVISGELLGMFEYSLTSSR